MNVIIIEDEPISSQKLEKLIKKYDADISVLSRLSSVKESVEWLKSNPHPDLIFMDIKLEDGNCFKIFDKVKVNVPVIFTTAYDDFLINAFQVHSVAYLLKPIDFEKLSFSISKFREMQMHYTARSQEIKALVEMLKPVGQQKYKSNFIVTTGQSIKTFRVDEIAYFYCNNKITSLVTHKNMYHIVDYSMDNLCEILDPSLFFRVNRQFIVKRGSVAKIDFYPKCRYLLSLEPAAECEVIVSIYRASDFKKWLEM